MEAPGGKLEHGSDLIPSDRKLLKDLVDRHAVLEGLEDDCGRRPRAFEHPRAADLAGHIFHRWTLRPVSGGTITLWPIIRAAIGAGAGSKIVTLASCPSRSKAWPCGTASPASSMKTWASGAAACSISATMRPRSRLGLAGAMWRGRSISRRIFSMRRRRAPAARRQDGAGRAACSRLPTVSPIRRGPDR